MGSSVLETLWEIVSLVLGEFGLIGGATLIALTAGWRLCKWLRSPIDFNEYQPLCYFDFAPRHVRMLAGDMRDGKYRAAIQHWDPKNVVDVPWRAKLRARLSSVVVFRRLLRPKRPT
jgi:hypothetical protein